MSETAEKVQHTPGPWTIAAWTSHGRIICTLKNKQTISKYIGYAQGYPEPDSLEVGMEEAEANARLFAAAPQMLESLERLQWYFTGLGMQREPGTMLGSIDAAIRAAKGEL